jgi:DHA2 family multidrug resistance protein
LKNGNLRVGTFLSFILGFGLYSSTFIVPLYTQSLLNWTAQQSGMLMIPAALTTAFMMPIIGQLLQRGVSQQLLVGIGFLIFAIYSFWGYTILTPDTGKDDFFWILIVRGVGMGMLFIPITTLSLSSLKGQQIGQGASFTGMMRQLGGSFGIALVTTFLSHQIQSHRADLLTRYNTVDPAFQNRVAAMQANFMSKGLSPNQALGAAYKALDGGLMRRASVLSYMDVFLYIGVLFIFCIPLVLVRKKTGEKIDLKAAASAH